ncbi:hypothetical protein [Sphingomonas xinjiangensis]|uniref:Uncharacterized protein n=1 Tax=Sphingomonas xinjiangensis TaxID=643568 RepID=A0A840Y940_9SPHN|nr:hypothetical protein [Sphingomonas xinjiangensis]MBB5708795.1 hypothetical protein [Sphingomonas xinjiangensis]
MTFVSATPGFTKTIVQQAPSADATINPPSIKRSPDQTERESTPRDPSSKADVIIEGRTKDAVATFVEQLTKVNRGHQISRWNTMACPITLGLNSEQARYLTERIRSRSREFGVPVAGQSCSANIVIVVTNDADEFTRQFLRRYTKLFQDTSSGISELAPLRGELLQSRPIRWLNASRTGGAGGGSLGQVYSGSRLRENSQENAILLLAIVDASMMRGVKWGQIADYLTMVALANPRMDARFRLDTIMSIFQARDAGGLLPTELTANDRSFLRALYRTHGAASAVQQRKQIESAITK